MGQIVSSAAKPKRCNLSKLSQLGTPAAGEHILVSSDNSMNATGQGNFDCYIVGNGRDAATALKLKSLVDDGVFDISTYRATGDVLAKYADIAAALDGGNNIPEAIRKGGMSVKFVQSSDNKYVRYNLLADSFTTDITQWTIDDTGVYVENPEFIYVKTDSHNSIVWAIKADGDFFFGAGCPQQVKDYVLANTAEIITKLNGIIIELNTKVDKVEGKGLSTNDFTNFEKEVVDTQELVDNPEFFEVKTDSEGRILESITSGFRKQVYMPIDTAFVSLDYTDNPEWIDAKIDSDGKILEGIRKDGTKVIKKLESPALDAKVEKEPGKELSSNDFTDEYKLNLETLSPVQIPVGDVTLAHGTGADARFSFLFDKPISFEDCAEINVIVEDYEVYGTEDDEGFSIQAWYKTPASGDNPTPIKPFTIKGNEIVNIPSKGHDYLYGIYLYTANRSSGIITLNATVVTKNLSSVAKVMMEQQGKYLRVPDYYHKDGYLDNKIRVISDYIRNTIINGDAFYFVTDTHWEYNMHHSPAIIRYMNNTLSIPRLFHGGDMYHRGLELDAYGVGCINAFRSAMDNSGQVYATDGNHEFMTQTETYGDVFAETRIYLKDVVYGGSHKNYYYVNNNQKKIRYVVLYSFGEYVNGSITNGFVDQAQLTWFNDTALNVEQGWEIFVFCHFITAIRPWGSYGEIVGASNIFNIINNYHGNGKIIAIIEGHTHWDAVMLDSCDVPIIATTSDHNYPFSFSGHTDFEELIEPRTNGTINEQAFDVVVYDKENGLINMVRVGSRAMNLSNSHAGDAQVDYRSVFVDGMTVGDNKTLETPLTGTVTWQSADSEVVSVNDGVITAVASGDTVITATSDSGEIHSFFIKVNPQL